MRAATVVTIGVAAALLAPLLAVPRAESHVPGEALPPCQTALALPEELNALVAPRGAASPCSPRIVFMPTPLTLVEISTEALAHIWAQPNAAPNARIEKAQQAIRGAYERVMDGLENLSGATDAAAAQLAARDGRTPAQ